MQTSTRLLALISAQQSLLINKDNQTERLSAELTRVEKGKQPYYIAVGVKFALKLIEMANEAGRQISDSLEYACEKTQLNQKRELKNEPGVIEAASLREAHRKIQVRLTASSFMQNIHTTLANRASENLCQAHLLIIGADGNSNPVNYLPTMQHLAGQMVELRDLTMSYAHDAAEYGEHIDKHDPLLQGDSFEVKTQKEALRLIQDFVDVHIESALNMMESAIDSIEQVNHAGDALVKEAMEEQAAKALAAASLARSAAQLLQEAICSMGSVSIVARITNNRLEANDLLAGLKGLTSHNADYHLN